MDTFIDMVMEAMRTGVIQGYTFLCGSYYYIEGEWYRGKQVVDAAVVRSVLYDYYIGNEDAVAEDKEWLDGVMHRLSTVSTS